MTSRNSEKLDGLTDKQCRFVSEYLLTLNATDAARKAGYKQPNVASAKLMANSRIAKCIGNAQRQSLEKLELTREAMLRELAFCALRDPADLCDEHGAIITDDIRKLPERVRRCIDGIKQRITTDKDGNTTVVTELKLSPKIAAVELAMRHFAMFAPQQHELKLGIDWERLYEDGSAKPAPDPIAERIAKLSQPPPKAIEQTPLPPLRYSVADLVGRTE